MSHQYPECKRCDQVLGQSIRHGQGFCPVQVGEMAFDLCREAMLSHPVWAEKHLGLDPEEPKTEWNFDSMDKTAQRILVQVAYRLGMFVQQKLNKLPSLEEKKR